MARVVFVQVGQNRETPRSDVVEVLQKPHLQLVEQATTDGSPQGANRPLQTLCEGGRCEGPVTTDQGGVSENFLVQSPIEGGSDGGIEATLLNAIVMSLLT
jgi:hypothetical protein